jgi:hypothetical protein
MHLWYSAPLRLQNKLPEFVGGQFLMERSWDGLVFRGWINDLSIPDIKRKLVRLEFSHLWEPYFGIDAFFTPVAKWKLVTLLSTQVGVMSLDYEKYYFQRKRVQDGMKPAREERVKLLTSRGEVWRLFKQGDPTNLVQQGAEILPCYKASDPEAGPDD